MAAKEMMEASARGGRGFDVRALQAGVDKMPRGLARRARKGVAMQAQLMPNVAGRPMQHQVATLWSAYAIFAYLRQPQEDNRNDAERVRRIVRFYGDLRAAGCALPDADGLRERHARVLLDLWRQAGRDIGAIRNDWSLLRGWCLALGKQGMIDRIEKYWPDAPKRVQSAPRTREQRMQDLHGNAQVLTELLRAKDRTSWYVERLVLDMGLTEEEALRLKPALCNGYVDGAMVLRAPSGSDFRVIPVDTDDKRVLLQEVVAYIGERGREMLAWSDLSPAQALRKHQKRLTYLRTAIRNREGRGGDPVHSELQAAGDESACEAGAGAQRADGEAS